MSVPFRVMTNENDSFSPAVVQQLIRLPVGEPAADQLQDTMQAEFPALAKAMEGAFLMDGGDVIDIGLNRLWNEFMDLKKMAATLKSESFRIDVPRFDNMVDKLDEAERAAWLAKPETLATEVHCLAPEVVLPRLKHWLSHTENNRQMLDRIIPTRFRRRAYMQADARGNPEIAKQYGYNYAGWWAVDVKAFYFTDADMFARTKVLLGMPGHA